MITLGNLSPNRGSNKNKKRVGRGYGTGNGKTAGRGHKGARARSGFKSKPGFEGGQMPLQRRLPKIGFTNTFSKEFRLISLSQLNTFDVTKPFKVKIDAISASARLKIETAGGSVELRVVAD